MTEATTSAALLARARASTPRAGTTTRSIHSRRRTRAGDLQAMSELGHRLLIGDRAPRLVPHALSFITEAARGGEGRALARVAALTAAGAHMPQDWPKALRLLGDAAAAGDASARGQLKSSAAPSSATDAVAARAAGTQRPTAAARRWRAPLQTRKSDWRALAARCAPRRLALPGTP